MLKNDSYAGKYIGGYHISLELAASASSRIFLGESVSPDRHSAAIKRIYAVSLISRQDKESFLNEVNALKQLKHPHILPILSASILKGTPYIVSSYAPNGSLHDRLQRLAPEPMNQDEAITVLSQVGQALHYAHEKDKVHSNLKPQNILFTGKGEALLTDFRLASLSSSPDNSAIISPHGLPYMSVEQIDGVISKENDQYSLGCIAYEMFTGRKPFTTPSIKQPGTYYKTRTLIAPTKLNPSLPRRIEQAILKAMAKEPSQRYRNVLEFIKALGAPGILIVPDDLVNEQASTTVAPIPQIPQKNVSPLFPGLKAATIGATTLVQFTAKSAPLLRNTFTSLAHFSTLPLGNTRLAVSLPTSKKRKVLRPLLFIASILLIAMLIAGMAFAFSPSHLHQGNKATTGTGATQPSQATTPHPTSAPTKTLQHITIPALPLQPTPAPHPRPTTPPATQPVPTHIVPPTATTPPKTTLSIAPTILNAGNCAHNNTTYTCTVALSLGAAATGSQNWYTYSIGVGANFAPSNGTIAPGQTLNIQINVFDNCTKMGTFVFVGSKTNVTTTWKC
jgi:serine/threonine protein kinase